MNAEELIPNVLIVDDEESIRYTLGQYLKEAGYRVCLAAAMDEALDRLDREAFQIAVVDRMLPGGASGLDLLARIRHRQPLCQVLLISGFPSFESAAAAIALDPFAYLSKPVRKSQILREADRAWHRYRELVDRTRREKLFESLFENSPNAVAIFDADQRIRFVNPNFSHLFGFSPEAAQGRRLPPVAPEFNNLERRHLAAARQGRTVPEYETVRLGREGEPIPVAVSLSICCSDTTAPGEIIAIFRDLREAKTLQRQLIRSQKLQAIGTLAGGIAHDFNNILTGIMGNCDLARLDFDADPERVRGRVENILNASLRARDLVQQILTFSRQKESVRKPAALGPLIHETLNLMNASTPAGIEVNLALDQGLPETAIDATQIRQVVLNLCTNAVYAMGERGGLTISLSEEALPEEGGVRVVSLPAGRYQVIRVRDTGPGMEPGVLSRIFDPFFTTKPTGVGTGIGLSIVYGIVKAHGGDIVVDSEPGRGSEFSVYFPAVAESGVVPIPEVVVSKARKGEDRARATETEPVADRRQATVEALAY